ncbi:MAG: HDOD domain-containing protein [Desulfobacterales bacterium]|nr:HDOD domain-containing protein [Desulfobacterales bacterium]
MKVFVARQPVFNSRKKIFGYELLFRLGLENSFPDIDGSTATSSVLSSTFFSFELNDILSGKPGLINFTRDLLVKQTPLLFPKEHIIIEVLEDIEPEPEIMHALELIKQQGFRIALDDFVYDNKFDGMIDLCDMIKFDLMATPLDTLEPVFSSVLEDRNITLLAEKVETHEEFEQAKAMGFDLFQGYFFSKPEVLSKQDISSGQITKLKLASEASREDPDLENIESLIKKDVSVSFKLLKFINSAYFQRRAPINTIKDAITFLGIDELKKFLNVVVVSDLNPGKPNELIRSSVIRARMCERCGSMLKTKFSTDELFVIGLFSSMDAIMDMPMDKILESIALSDRIKDALLGRDAQFRQLNSVVSSFEQGNWTHQRFQTGKDGKLIQELPTFYMDALKMADSFFTAT